MNSNWELLYRPKTLDDVIFQDENQSAKFKSFITNDHLPNILLSGIRGTGKTSIIKALVKGFNISHGDYMSLNCSDKNIDTLRNEANDFSMTMPMGKFKVLVLEEFNRLSKGAQDLLKKQMDDTGLSCKWLATCNNESLLTPEIKDRFQIFNFKAPDKEQVAVRMVHILDTEKINFDIEHLLTYIDIGYPSIRKIIQLLEANSINGVLQNPKNATQIQDWKADLLPLLSKSDWRGARYLICSAASKEDYEEVYTFLYQNIDKVTENQDEAILIISEYLNNHGNVVDPEINMAAMFISLSKL
jgi:DNA polymerase III delta prime subunit